MNVPCQRPTESTRRWSSRMDDAGPGGAVESTDAAVGPEPTARSIRARLQERFDQRDRVP